MKNLPVSLAALLYVAGILSPALADERLTGISVVGECLKKVPRDRGAVTVSSSIVAPSAKEASKKATEAHEKIKKDVLSLKLPELTSATVGYSVNQECHYGGKGGRVCEGYRTTISTRFETSQITSLEDVIAVATKYGAEDVAQLDVFVSPPLLKTERESCLEIATQNARAKAEKIAHGAGVTLGKLISVSEGGENSQFEPMRLPRSAMALSAAPDKGEVSGPSIDAQPLDLQVSVNAVYGIQ